MKRGLRIFAIVAAILMVFFGTANVEVKADDCSGYPHGVCPLP